HDGGFADAGIDRRQSDRNRGAWQQQPTQREQRPGRAGNPPPDQDYQSQNIDARRELANAPIAREVVVGEPCVPLDSYATDQVQRGRTAAERLRADYRPYPKEAPGRKPAAHEWLFTSSLRISCQVCASHKCVRIFTRCDVSHARKECSVGILSSEVSSDRVFHVAIIILIRGPRSQLFSLRDFA